jgi:hypothetical protein
MECYCTIGRNHLAFRRWTADTDVVTRELGQDFRGTLEEQTIAAAPRKSDNDAHHLPLRTEGDHLHDVRGLSDLVIIWPSLLLGKTQQSR